MTHHYGFNDKLQRSKAASADDQRALLLDMIPGARGFAEVTTDMDRRGIDYVVRLADGGVVYIDGKQRDAGISRYWKQDLFGEKVPELALESWSVVPATGNTPKVGWTKDGTKQTHLVLFTFDPADYHDVFLLSFPLLRMAFIANEARWKRLFLVQRQSSGTWQSECVFVPVPEVQRAIFAASCYRRVQRTITPGMVPPVASVTHPVPRTMRKGA